MPEQLSHSRISLSVSRETNREAKGNKMTTEYNFEIRTIKLLLDLFINDRNNTFICCAIENRAFCISARQYVLSIVRQVYRSGFGFENLVFKKDTKPVWLCNNALRIIILRSWLDKLQSGSSFTSNDIESLLFYYRENKVELEQEIMNIKIKGWQAKGITISDLECLLYYYEVNKAELLRELSDTSKNV